MGALPFRKLQRLAEGLVRGNRDIGRDALAFPIPAGVRIIGAPDRNECSESAKRLEDAEMVRACRRFAHQRRAMGALEREGQMLGSKAVRPEVR